MPVVLHVATTGDDSAPGTEREPLRTIGRGAALVRPGGTVRVHEGVYRECVAPARGGLDAARCITFEAAEGEHVAVKGSEVVTGWRHEGGRVWRAEVPAHVFGAFNPFAEQIAGDWLVRPEGGPARHLGDVYVDGVSGYEAASRADLDAAGTPRTHVLDHWTGLLVPVDDPRRTTQQWYAEVGPRTTTVWATFDDDPAGHLVEVSVRRSVFWPARTGVDHVTVRGFELAQAATPWAPPTAEQVGLIGPRWSRGWVIEHNDIHDAKCSAVSLGKEAATGDNHATHRGDKPGYQYQLESVFAARHIGWHEARIGGHVVRRNTIHECGQNAVVGHLGGAFCTVEHNEIHHVGLKREFYGYEIAGVKLHAAIDTVLRHNHVHDCSLGIWLDWQTQGTRVTGNVLHDNRRDLFVEVSHGPYVVDHNVFGSPAALELFSQGGAFVANLVLGTLRLETVPDRATPYHVPHSTEVAGYAVVEGGDDRWVANVFVGGDRPAYGPPAEGTPTAGHGTAGYDGHPASTAEYLARVHARPAGDHGRFLGVPQPVHARGNVYLDGAVPFAGEQHPHVFTPSDAPAAPAAALEVRDDGVHLVTDLPAGFADAAVAVVTGADLEPVRLAAAGFEQRDGRPVVLDVDVVGARRPGDRPGPAGPVAALAPGRSQVRLR